MVRLALFDIDGTLIHTGGAGVRAFERTFALQFGIGNATDRLVFSGRTDTSLVRQCFHAHGIEESRQNMDRFFDTYVFLLHSMMEDSHGQTCPGVSELIADLRETSPGMIIGLLTGNIRLGAEIKLRRHQLWHLFQSGAFGDDHEERNKLAEIAKERGGRILGCALNGDEVLVIGDTPLDIECARSINARILSVATGGFDRDELHDLKPDWVVENLSEIRAADLCG
jgi:phosphoglycolate phosphatase-like HAD superfamily hydrolase